MSPPKPAKISQLPPPSSLATALAKSIASAALPLDPQVPEAIWNTALLGPLLEFAQRPGKAFRDQLTRLAYAGCDGNPAMLPSNLGAIVETIHAGSLIIDDVQDCSEQRG